MPCYFVVHSTITDRQVHDEYVRIVGRTFVGHEATFLVVTGEAEPIEGEAPGKRWVIIEFPDADAFHRWYDSPAYQEVVGLRLSSTEGFAVLAPGAD